MIVINFTDWFKKLDKKILAIVILSIALALSIGVITYVKKVDGNTISTLRELSTNLKSGNEELGRQLDAAINRVGELEKSNQGLNGKVADLTIENNRAIQRLNELTDENRRVNEQLGELSAENKRSNDKVRELAEDNRRSNGKLSHIAGLASAIAEVSGDAEATVDRIVKLIRGIQEAISN
jgi:TolA-binding protein